jgi:hypothetical protein
MKAEAIFLVLQAVKPDVDEGRLMIMSLAAETALAPYPDEDYLRGAILTAIEHESGFMESVHSGELRGKAGEICLVQIHPTNGFWKQVATEFDELGGLDIESTTKCLTAGVLTLRHSRGYCRARRFYKNWAPAMWTKYHYGNRCWLSPHAYKRTRRMHFWIAKLSSQK